MNNLSIKFKALIGLSLLTVGLGGCDLTPTPPETILTNAQIIAAKDQCIKGGMGYVLLSYNGNAAFPYKVVCARPG